MTEEKLQSECFKWFWNTFPEERRMLFHVDNNSWNQVIGAKKKALGVCAGVADMIYVLPNGRVVFLETKIPGGSQSEVQKEFQLKIQDREHFYFIYTSIDQFKGLIKTFQDGRY
jgi:hypothetical protein